MGLPVISSAPVTLRHIKQGAGAGQITVLGATLLPQPRKGVNGRRGYQKGNYEPALNDEGTATLSLPNTVGDDGILHRRRFQVFTDPGYHPGDEWIEILQGNRALFVGTPLGGRKTRGELTLNLADGQWLLRKQRETAAGFWTHAPRDAFEHYTKAWTTLIADDFTTGADPARWTKSGAVDQSGSVRLPGTVGGTALISALASFWGWIPFGSHRAWRLELEYDINTTPPTQFIVDLIDKDSGTPQLSLTFDYSTAAGLTSFSVSLGGQLTVLSAPLVKLGGRLAIESRDRWVHCYIDGKLLGVLENTNLSDTDRLVVPRLTYNDSAAGFVDIKSLLLRRADPYLLRGATKGDYRLPGAPPTGGLQGTYFDDADLRTGSSTSRLAILGNPTRAPYARRQDATVNFTSVTPVVFQPAGPPNGEHFSVRWTGAIFLDLATADVQLRLTQFNQSVRLWVGKTMFGDVLLNRWSGTGAATLTSGSLRTHLGANISGWYPIRLEWAQTTGANGIALQQSIGGGAFAAVPSTSLSPYGIYDTTVRYDSHGEQLKAIAETFGLQYRLDPRSLESGLFPGEVVPRVRVGRDTDKVLEPAESTDVSVDISADDVVDTLLADAAGISDKANAAQLTAEDVNYPTLFEAVAAERHMMVLSEYESLTDISDPGLLRTRLDSLLGLRSTVWQEVGARPRGYRERRDTFPLTGSLALFAWEPGDGIRVSDPDLDLEDSTPRQIIAPSWPFIPDGLGAPSVRFRQRPRSQQDALRSLVRDALLPQRNYQGTLVVVNGTLGALPTSPVLPDAVSRVSLPTNMSDIVGADLVVYYKSDTSTGTIRVNNVSTGLTLTTTGRYDILPYVARYETTTSLMLADLTGATGNNQYSLELLVRV